MQYIPLKQDLAQSPILQKMFPQVSAVSSTLKKWFEIILTIKDHAQLQTHFPICNQVAEEQYLKQICCFDNAKTDTQASVWADTGSKQVRSQRIERSLSSDYALWAHSLL